MSEPQKPLSVAEARDRILTGVTPLASVTVPLVQATGRTLSADITARLTQPPFAASAMDGYAIRAEDQTAPLTVIGEAAAGHAFGGTVGSGQAARIFTGAPVPDGADTILIQEDAARDGDTLHVREAAPPGIYIRPAGGDFKEGDTGPTAGTKIGAHHIGLTAAMGHAELPVRRQPVVALLATGDELVPPGDAPGPGQIVSSNAASLASLCAQAGAQPVDLGIAKDTKADLAAHLEHAREADIIVTIGGASVGDHDLVQPALKDFGVTMDFWKIAMRPGKPLMFGTQNTNHEQTRYVLGVPGNPVSALVCARIFLVPLIHALLGNSNEHIPQTQKLPLANAIPANGPREHYMRARIITATDGSQAIHVHGNQDSSLLSVLTNSDALVIHQPGAPALAAGTMVPVLPLGL